MATLELIPALHAADGLEQAANLAEKYVGVVQVTWRDTPMLRPRTHIMQARELDPVFPKYIRSTTCSDRALALDLP